MSKLFLPIVVLTFVAIALGACVAVPMPVMPSTASTSATHRRKTTQRPERKRGQVHRAPAVTARTPTARSAQVGRNAVEPGSG